MFVFKWRHPSQNKGITEFVPDEWFYAGSDHRHLEYEYKTAQGKTTIARCSLVVSGTVALFDFEGEHTRYNRSNDVDLGQWKWTFSDETFTQPIGCEWRPTGGVFEKSAGDFVPFVWDEGLVGLTAHFRRERNPKLVREKLASMSVVRCEACNYSFSDHYGELGERFCEVHHTLPLHLGRRLTELKDLAVLCSNCHRMIHRTKPLMSVKEFAAKHVKVLHGSHPFL